MFVFNKKNHSKYSNLNFEIISYFDYVISFWESSIYWKKLLLIYFHNPILNNQTILFQSLNQLTIFSDVEDQDKLQFARLDEMKMRSQLVMPSGDELKWDCKANGKEPIVYTWYKNNEKLFTRRVDSSLVTDQPQLVLKDLVPSDSAIYTCKVRNNMSSIQHNFTLTVQGLYFIHNTYILRFFFNFLQLWWKFILFYGAFYLCTMCRKKVTKYF